MTSHLSLISASNHTNPGSQLYISNYEKGRLLSVLSRLVPILKELNLADTVLPASTVASILRNRRRTVGHTYTAKELVGLIVQFERLVVDGIEIRASWDEYGISGKPGGSISFRYSDMPGEAAANLSDRPVNIEDEATVQARKCRQEARLLKQQEDWIARNMTPAKCVDGMFSLKALEQEQREALGRKREQEWEPGEFFEDERELLDHLRSLMPKHIIEAGKLKDTSGAGSNLNNWSLDSAAVNPEGGGVVDSRQAVEFEEGSTSIWN